jgi:hypothetical protein
MEHHRLERRGAERDADRNLSATGGPEQTPVRIAELLLVQEFDVDHRLHQG